MLSYYYYYNFKLLNLFRQQKEYLKENFCKTTRALNLLLHSDNNGSRNEDACAKTSRKIIKTPK